MQPASSQSAFDWEGGSIDELIQMLTVPALAVRVEVRTPSAGKPKKVGEIHLVAGGVSEVIAGELRGDDAMDQLRGVSPLSFRLQPRLPNPDDGGLLVPGPSEGTLAERPPAELMRYCELYVLTCVIEIWRDTDRAEIEYRKGEIARTVVNGVDAPEQLHEVMNWSSGGYRVVLPDLSLPAPTSRTPQPQMVQSPGASGAMAPARTPAPAPQRIPLAPAVQRTPAPQPQAQTAVQAKTMFGMPAAMAPVAVQTASPAASAAARATQRRVPEVQPQPEKRDTSSGMRVDLYDRKEPERITNVGVPAVDVGAPTAAARPSAAARPAVASPAPKREQAAPAAPQEDLTTLPGPVAPTKAAPAAKGRPTDGPRPLESHQQQKQRQKKKSAQKAARAAEKSGETAARPAGKREMSVGAHIAIGLALGLGIAAVYWVIQIIGGRLIARAAEILRLSRKPRDIPWNQFVARPLAAVLLTGLERTAITPNQVTFLSLAVFAGAVAMLVALPSHAGLIGAVAVLELSYVLDCADGQLARLRGRATAVGAHLDFLADELKALALVVGVTIRLWLGDAQPLWLLEGLCGAAVVGAGLSLTTFRRRPEYAAATGAIVDQGAGDYQPERAIPAAPEPSATPVRAAESIGRLLIHYPSYLPIVAITNRMDLFLHIYLLANAAHAARCLLGVTLRLGRG